MQLHFIVPFSKHDGSNGGWPQMTLNREACIASPHSYMPFVVILVSQAQTALLHFSLLFLRVPYWCHGITKLEWAFEGHLVQPCAWCRKTTASTSPKNGCPTFPSRSPLKENLLSNWFHCWTARNVKPQVCGSTSKGDICSLLGSQFCELPSSLSQTGSLPVECQVLTEDLFYSRRPLSEF